MTARRQGRSGLVQVQTFDVVVVLSSPSSDVLARRNVDSSRSIISGISAQRRGMTAREGMESGVEVSRLHRIKFYGESQCDDDVNYIDYSIEVSAYHFNLMYHT